MALDTDRLRKDFPVLDRLINEKPIIYMDNACMTLRPRQVIEAVTGYYENQSACGGRSVHRLGAEVTDMADGAREKMAALVGASSPREIVFTKNTTESINLAARSLGLGKGDRVLTTDREHNSNLVPWHILATERGVRHEVVPSADDNTFDTEAFKEMMGPDVKLVSMVHVANLDGSSIPAREIAEIVHDHGALLMLDAAQSVPHTHMDVREIDADLMAWSVHKMMGPTGVGCLYGKYEVLDGMAPFIGGGETVELTTYEGSSFLKPPGRFEGGLQHYAGIIGAGAAADYLMELGPAAIGEHERALNAYITREVNDMEGVSIIGPADPDRRAGIISMHVEGVNPHDIAITLDESANIMVRSGAHCVHSWFRARGIDGSIRASLYAYNTMGEARAFMENFREIVGMLRP